MKARKNVLCLLLCLCICVEMATTASHAAYSKSLDQVRSWLDNEVNMAVQRGDGECVPFCNYYLTDCWGTPAVSILYAKDWYCPEGWTEVPLNSAADFQMGDVVVEDWGDGVGHVCVYYGVNGDGRHTVVDQNFRDIRVPNLHIWYSPLSCYTRCFRPPVGGTASTPSVSSQYPTNVKVTTSKSSYQPNETVIISVTGNNYNWFSIHIDKDGTTVYENYDYNTSSINFSTGTPGTYKVTVSACKDWEHYTDAQCSFTVAPATASVSFSPWENGNYTYIGETDAGIGQQIDVSNGTCTEVGMELYDQNGTRLAVGRDYSYYYRMYFKINEECGYTLTPGTTYKYKFYAVVNGETYWGNVGSFKTTGTAPVNYSISIDKSSLSLSAGNNATLSASVSPAGTPVSWSSSNPGVATVSNGKVTAVSAGTATITAMAGGKSASCTVTVSAANIAVASVTLTQNTLTLKPGSDAILTATVNPANATNKTVTWSSSNSSVATVNNGKVVAVKEGTATITATAGGKTASCSVKVSPATVTAESVALSQTSISLKFGESQTLTATVNPSNATDKTVTWSSSNPSVATVSDGKVTAVGAGNATITASAGGKTVSCSVTVAQKSALQIGTAGVPSATVGTAYHQTLVANSTDSVTWSVTSGALPSGLTLSNSGVISGTPTGSGTYSFTVTAASNAGTDSKTYTLTVNGNESASKADVHFERKNVYHQDQFTDVKANQWFTDTVASAFELGLMKGDSATTFNPYGDVTVAEAITMAARVHSINATGAEHFVQSGNWYQVYLDYAYQNGIISYAYYNSDVTQKATRAQFAEIFAASLPAQNLSAINQIADNAVPDVKMSENYAGSVYTLYRAGILTGSDALGHFNPQTYITRAEAATILSRMAESNNRVGFSLGG